MKVRNFKLSFLVLAIFVSLLAAVPTSADGAATIHLQVVTFDQVLFDGDFIVNACLNDNGGGDLTVNAWCAVTQLSASQGWTASSTWYSYGVMLTSLNQYDGADGNYWLWYSNNEPGETALSQHVLAAGENLLLAYAIKPLKITASNTSPVVNSTSTLSVAYFDAELWSWQTVADSDLVINGQTAAGLSNPYNLLVSTTTPYIIIAKKTGFLDSPAITITGVAAPTDNQSVSVGGAVKMPVDFQTDQAVNFLSANQAADGSIGQSVIYSDWSALALAAYGDSPAKDKLKQYLLTSNYNTPSAVGVTDLGRRAMALMALGVNPYNGTAVNYIEKIAAAFDGQQIGEPTVFNDDIFSLLILLKAGWTAAEPIIDKTLNFIISAQSSNGSWGGVDLTAAAVQSLTLAQTDGNLSDGQKVLVWESLNKARGYLQLAQQPDASFNHNVFSTAWAVQAIIALQEPLTDWTKNNQTPLNFLALSQASDGGLNHSADLGSRLWATAYAVPAGLQKSWGDMLGAFNKPVVSVVEKNSLPTIATSSEEIIASTSTLAVDVATSTPSKEIVESQEKITATDSAPASLIKPRLALAASQPAPSPIVKKPATSTTALPAQVLGDKIAASTTPQPVNNPASPVAVNIIFYTAGAVSILLGAYLVGRFIFRHR